MNNRYDTGDPDVGPPRPDPTATVPLRGFARLRFADASVEARFRAAYAQRTLVAMRFAILAGVAMFAAFGLLDATVAAPDELGTVRLIRFAVVVPFLALGAVVLLLANAHRYALYVVSAAVLGAGVGLIGIISAMSAAPALPYYAGFLLIQMFAYTVTQLPFAHATWVGWTVTLLYDAVAVTRGVDGAVLLSHNFFLVAGNLAGMASAWFMERLRRSDFAAQLVLSRDHAQLERLAGELEEIAQRDPLTGLLNRRQLDERLAHAIHLHHRYHVDTSLVLVDLDDFKYVNDTYGHPIGDALLAACATALRSCTRATDQVFRYGGDEFLVLAPETPTDVAMHIAERIHIALSKLDVAGISSDITVRCSVGVACVCEADADPAAVLVRVDEALYSAKRQGKACTVVAAPMADC